MKVEGNVLTFKADSSINPGKYTLTVKDKNGKYADLKTTFILSTTDMPATYDADNKKLTVAENSNEEAFNTYIGNITSVNVNGTDYAASGRGSVKIIDKDGTLVTDAAPFKDAAVGTEFQITVTSTGYTTPLTFTYKVPGETPAPSEVDTTKLAAAIEKAEGLNESDYTKDSWKALQSALAEADTALKEKKDQDTVDKATEKLNKAISALVKKDAGQKVNGTNGTTGTSGKSGKTGSTSNTKSGKAAKTGDPSGMFTWLGLAVTSLGAGIGGFSLKRKKREDEENAYSIDSTFIPDHEIPGVSAQVKDVPEKAFSMLQLGSPKKKEVSIANLRLLTALYGDWIKNELKENPQMQESSFQATGKSIIEKCLDSLRRMNEGIDLIEKDENAFKAFTFMNQSMYLQRSITAYSKDCGRGIPCSLSDYMKDNKEKGIEQDHSEWRPFQIAFILLNIKGLIDPESDERNIVDLLYFPTGGGKTEAYLGLIAFIIAYRRLTSDSDYEKDGGVTVFLRYTLRLLTTQQRDRLLKLIVAMEDLRERSEKNGKAEFGTTPISIGYWVGGSVTPNKFDEYEKDEYSRKEFVRKVTKQIIRCPYCGKLIGRENYDINTKTNSVKITCSYDKCKFSKSSGKSIPVYLVDEEIYAKCPTVVISTVDKFAKLPWSEQAGLLFGRTDRFCPRHGYQAVGYEKELVGKRHNKDTKNGLDACVIEACKPFYPPQLIIQDELHLISGPLGTIYGGYETIIEDMCCLEKNGKKIHPKYVVSTATIKNAGEQIKCLYARENYAQFPPSGFDTRDSYFIREVPLVSRDLEDLTENDIAELLEKGEKPFRQYVGICASGQSVKTTLIRLYSVLLQEAFILSEDPKYQNYVDPYYTLVGYFNSIRELGGAVRLLDDDINSRLKVLRKKYKNARQRYLGFDGKKEITSRIPSYQIAEILEKLAEPFDPSKERQSCYDVVIATNMIAVGMDVDRLGLMAVVGQPKQNSEYIQATSRVGRKYPGIIFTVYNPYRPRDLSNYENFVGFHSQMYRYVEGTTATPFAARARDRVLHALVVAMLRLQTETMAGNKGASNILSISDEELGKIKDQILERISIVAPMAYESASDDIDAFISTWKEIAKDENLYYFVTNTENNKRLLSYYGQPITGKEKPTLNSMRDVEQSSTVYLYEEGGAL